MTITMIQGSADEAVGQEGRLFAPFKGGTFFFFPKNDSEFLCLEVRVIPLTSF